ncbi:MAG: hypothetical protein KF861_15365 [Planctomycetaceae bacterium]|nr:hypothetical protein [Planctomycetaceae bacterium]
MRANVTLTCMLMGFALSVSQQGDCADVYGLEAGTPKIQSAGHLAFGPDGILFVGDARGAAVFAVATGDKSANAAKAEINVDDLLEKLGGQLGVRPREVVINDLAVNPASGNVYVSLTIEESEPAIVKIGTDGKISPVSLKNVPFSKVDLPNAPKDEIVQRGRRQINLRDETITDLAFVDGQVLISGLTDQAAPSTVRSVAFPFSNQRAAANVEIYHGAHGRQEDNAAIRTFVPFTINGEASLLAGFQCTPLVKFPLNDVTAGSKIEGTTVAELGNRNRPLDMIVYQKDGKDFLLIANSDRGVMKVSTDTIATQEAIKNPVEGGGTAGLAYETIGELTGVEQLDKLNDRQAVVLTRNGNTLNLQTVALP